MEMHSRYGTYFLGFGYSIYEENRIEFSSIDDRLEEKTDQNEASRSSDQNRDRSDQIRPAWSES
jgi:hypothetical protein